MMIFAHIRDNFSAAFFPRLAEWTCAAVTVALGWMLKVNFDLMHFDPVTKVGKGYELLLSIASQDSWSRALMFFGAARLLVLLINGAWKRSPWARAGMAFLSSFFWFEIAQSFAPTFGYVFIFSSAFLALDTINVMRAMRDARTVDDALRGERGGHS